MNFLLNREEWSGGSSVRAIRAKDTIDDDVACDSGAGFPACDGSFRLDANEWLVEQECADAPMLRTEARWPLISDTSDWPVDNDSDGEVSAGSERTSSLLLVGSEADRRSKRRAYLWKIGLVLLTVGGLVVASKCRTVNPASSGIVDVVSRTALNSSDPCGQSLQRVTAPPNPCILGIRSTTPCPSGSKVSLRAIARNPCNLETHTTTPSFWPPAETVSSKPCNVMIASPCSPMTHQTSTSITTSLESLNMSPAGPTVHLSANPLSSMGGTILSPLGDQSSKGLLLNSPTSTASTTVAKTTKVFMESSLEPHSGVVPRSSSTTARHRWQVPSMAQSNAAASAISSVPVDAKPWKDSFREVVSGATLRSSLGTNSEGQLRPSLVAQTVLFTMTITTTMIRTTTSSCTKFLKTVPTSTSTNMLHMTSISSTSSTYASASIVTTSTTKLRTTSTTSTTTSTTLFWTTIASSVVTTTLTRVQTTTAATAGSTTNVREVTEVFLNTFCTHDEDGIVFGVIFSVVSENECRILCKDDLTCNYFEMRCTTQGTFECVLLTTCAHNASSQCGSYVSRMQ